MHIPYTRLNQHAAAKNKQVDIIEFRIDPHKRPFLLQQAGVYPDYHMNKENWLCVVLNDTQTDQQIMKLVTQSRQFLCQPHTWLIPANPRYYDIMHAFNEPNELLLWKQSTKVRAGDPVFIYVTNPVKAVIFQCRAVQVNIPYHYRSKQVRLNQAMKLQLVKRYPANKYDFNFLKAHGIRYIRGPRKLSNQLAALLQ